MDHNLLLPSLAENQMEFLTDKGAICLIEHIFSYLYFTVKYLYVLYSHCITASDTTKNKLFVAVSFMNRHQMFD